MLNPIANHYTFGLVSLEIMSVKTNWSLRIGYSPSELVSDFCYFVTSVTSIQVGSILL